MELSEQTISVLNNFKTIQSNMVFQEGNVIRTMADAKNIVGRAVIDSDIPQEFGIYELGEFLATLGLVDNPVLDLKKDHAVVTSTSGRSRIKYFFSDPDMLTWPKRDYSLEEGEVEFVLDENTLTKLKRAASTLGHEILTIKPSKGALELSVCDPENSTSNTFSIDVAAKYKGEFTFVMNMSNLKVMSTDYDVIISKKPLMAQFASRNPNIPVTYWIAMEKTSSVE